MGQLVKGGLLKPLDAYADAYGWKDRWSKTLLDLNRFSADGKHVRRRQPLRRLAAGRDRRRLLQQGQGQDRAEDVRRVRGDARQGQEGRRDPDLVRQPRQVRRHPRVPDRPEPVRRQAGDARLRVRQERRELRHVGEQARPRRSSRSGPRRATSRKDFNGTGYDPAWQQFTKGKGPFTIAGTWITADALKALGDKLGFFLMPGQRGGRASRSRSAARACRGRSPRSRSTPTSRPPTSTSSPTPRPPTCRSRPTTCPPCRRATAAVQGAGRRRTSSPPGSSSTTATA